MTRLSRHELRELGRVAASLITVHESLQHTNWAGAAPSAALVAQSIDAVVAIYSRRKHWLPEVRREMERAELEARQAELERVAAEGEGDKGAPGTGEDQ